MPASTNYALARKAQLEVRYIRRLAAMAEIEARRAELDALRATRHANRCRDNANLGRIEQDQAEAEYLRTVPDRRRAEQARHAPEEAGRYFRAALEDIDFARADLIEARDTGHTANLRAEWHIKKAEHAEKKAQDLRRKSQNEEARAESFTKSSEDHRRKADVYLLTSRTALAFIENSDRVTIEATRMFVAIAEANPEDPPYLNPAEIEIHNTILDAARSFLATEKPDLPLSIVVDGQDEASQEMLYASWALTDVSLANFHTLPYPQGAPGSGRSLEELNDFLTGLARPNVNDLDPADRQCHICRDPYPMDGAQPGVPESVNVLDPTKPEIPLSLPVCNHTFGSSCLQQWLTPVANDFCPFCSRRLFEKMKD